ncbi:MAG: hypothetical protein Q4E57_02435 [Eubacteriales bacterium]|nr:hypothetical protein [Eubacteriales bacterium]
MWEYIAVLKKRIAQNKRAFVVYSVLRFLVILTGIRCFFTRNYESLCLCILSLILLLVPSFFEDKLKVSIPPLFQVIIYGFIYAAEILGEVNKYYTAIPGWDTMLHTLNGFLCAAIGLSLAYILNHGNSKVNLSPAYVAVMAFCFSMTIGVCWEFFEFTADQFFHLDMQKDFIVTEIGSVTLDPSNSQIPVYLPDIVRTTIELADGSFYTIEGGYLDIGIIDTMKDLLVNFAGAVVFSVIGYLYELNQEKRSIVKGLLILPDDEGGTEQ